MAFLIPDNLKSNAHVSSTIRRVAGAFQIGLDDGVTVWYEPLYDPTGEKPHFVILIPFLGIIVLEVLDVEATNILGVIRGRLRIRRDGEEVEADSPLIRAKRLVDVLRQRIALEPQLYDANIPIAAGAVLPNMNRDEAVKKRIDRTMPLDECITRDEIRQAMAGDGESALLRIFSRMLKTSIDDHIPVEHESILRGVIQPDLVINKPETNEDVSQITVFRSHADEENVIQVMDRMQETIAKNIGSGHRVIRGVAGSGKTLILMYRAKLLAKMHPTWNILVTCYTRSLAGQLRELLKDSPNVEVLNIDRLMAKVIREAKMRHPGYKAGDDAVAQVALEAIQGNVGPRYEAVLIDEAQDLSSDTLRFAVNLLADGHDDLIVVADAAQNIFRKQFSWKQAGIQAQGRTRILRLNYRNTREILDFASNFLMADDILHTEDAPDLDDENMLIPPESAARRGEPPTVTVVESVEDEVMAVVEQVRAWIQTYDSPQSIAVLYGSTWERRNRGYLLYNELQKLPGGVFWLTGPDRQSRDQLGKAQERIILATIHSAKGLEFPCVVLSGMWREADDPVTNRMLAYVGMTRACERLSIITLQNSPLTEDLVQVAGEEQVLHNVKPKTS